MKAKDKLGEAQVDQRELATAIAVLLNGKSELAKWIWDEYALICAAEAREEASARELAMANHPTAYGKDEDNYCSCPECSSQD